MAGQFITLGDVRKAANYRADLEGLLERHPVVDMNREANLSYRDLRVKLANAEVPTVLQPTAILSLPTTDAVVGGGYAEIDWPTGAVSVHGLDVKIGGYWCTVPQANFVQRRMGPVRGERGDYAYANEGTSSWIVRSLPTSNGTSPAAGKIMLHPTPTGGQYVLWHLPEWIDLVTDTEVFPGQESWLQWVIWDVACKCLVRDIGPNTSAQLEKCEVARERAWALIRSNTLKLAGDGTIEPTSRYGRGRGLSHRLIP